MVSLDRNRCSYCERQRAYTFPASRQGGGTYRRAGRFYRGHICLHCAESLVRYALRNGVDSLHAGATTSRYDTRSLMRGIADARQRNPLIPGDLFTHPTHGLSKITKITDDGIAHFTSRVHDDTFTGTIDWPTAPEDQDVYLDALHDGTYEGKHTQPVADLAGFDRVGAVPVLT